MSVLCIQSSYFSTEKMLNVYFDIKIHINLTLKENYFNTLSCQLIQLISSILNVNPVHLSNCNKFHPN